MATAGHFGIETPRSEMQTINSINADEISFGSQEGSFVSPTKLKQQQQPKQGTRPQQFLSRLTQPTGNTPLGEIKNNVRPPRNGMLGKTAEFTPLLKSVKKAEFLRRGLPNQTPSKIETWRLGNLTPTSNIPETRKWNQGSISGIAEGLRLRKMKRT